jgi:hypothetical protein
VGDWKDDAARRACDQMAKARQDVEAFNNKQRLINGRAEIIWGEAITSLNEALTKINQGSHKISAHQRPAQPESREVELTYSLPSPIVGSMSWRPPEQRIVILVTKRQGGSREYKFDVDGCNVVLSGDNSTLKNGDDLAREFIETLMAQ